MPADCTDPFGLAAFFEGVKQMFAHTVHRPTHTVAASEGLECNENFDEIMQELQDEEAHWEQ